MNERGTRCPSGGTAHDRARAVRGVAHRAEGAVAAAVVVATRGRLLTRDVQNPQIVGPQAAEESTTGQAAMIEEVAMTTGTPGMPGTLGMAETGCKAGVTGTRRILVLQRVPRRSNLSRSCRHSDDMRTYHETPAALQNRRRTASRRCHPAQSLQRRPPLIRNHPSQRPPSLPPGQRPRLDDLWRLKATMQHGPRLDLRPCQT